MRHIFAISILVLCIGLSEAAQPPRGPETPWWLSTGVGIAGNEHDGVGVYGRSSLNISFAKYRFAAFRYMQTLEPMLRSWDRMREYALMVGLCTPNNRWGLISIAAGPAYNYFSNPDYYVNEIGVPIHGLEKSGSTIGLAYESQLMFKPVRYIGLGLVLAGNSNSEESVIGGMLSLTVGWIE